MSSVLVVDDDPIYLQSLSDWLDDWHIELLSARDAREAMNVLAHRSVHAVIVDGMLPEISGLDLLRQLKSDASFAHLPVIFQSATSSLTVMRKARQAGAAYCLPKRVEPLLLRTIVEGTLRAAEQRARAEREPCVTPALIRLLLDATFEFRTLEEARDLALELGRLCPAPDRATVGLVELFVNAIEHGNLEITYAEKSRLRRLDGWEAEVERRLNLPAYASRRGQVRVTRDRTRVRFVVRDEGPGFSWSNFLDFDPARTFDPNGRGIALARAMVFSTLTYEAPGNVVVADVSLERTDDDG